MNLLYIDESGSSNLKKENVPSSAEDGNSLFFILSGILIRSDELEKLENKIFELKDEYLIDPFIELKSTIKNKSLKKGKDRIDFLDKLYDLIAESDSQLFCAQIQKYNLYSDGVIKSKDDIYQLAFEHLLVSVNEYIIKEKIEKSTTVLIDNIDRKHNKKIYIAYKNALQRKTGQMKSFNSISFSPSINFVDSEFTVGVQLADLVAGAMFRGVEKGKKESATKLKNKFPLDTSGNLFGYSYRVCKNWLK